MVTPDKKIDSSSAEAVWLFIATWNTHDTRATLELLDPDIVFRSPLFSSPVRGIEARRGELENFLTSMPDFNQDCRRRRFCRNRIGWEWNLNGPNEATRP
jgi:SnoaL-like protein